MRKKVFIGVAWPYVNGTLHVGHLAGYLLPADIAARYHRAVGKEVLMVSGSDCFGTPITVEADKRGVSPEVVVQEHHKSDVGLFTKTLNLSYDLYTKTDHPNHIAVVQDMFVKLCEDGYVFLNEVLQYYSPKDKRFLPDRYVVGECPFCHFPESRSDQCDNCGKLIPHGELINPKSTLTGSEVGLKKTLHYFLDWPKLQKQIEAYVDQHGPEWKSWVSSEATGWLKEGLQPRAITRDLDWGVPIPVDRLPKALQADDLANKRIYVWFDAVIGYLSASKLWSHMNGKDWEVFWHGDSLKHYYFMGKDNLVFHTIFWPGQLMAYDASLHLPDVVSINMFLDLEGKKFSKSRGVVIPIKDFVEEYGNNAARFYLTYIMPEYRDASFSWSDFEEKVNNVLVANLGNYIHRTLSIAKKLEPDALRAYPIKEETIALIKRAYDESRDYLEACEFKKYLNAILELSGAGNKFIDKERIWELQKSDPERFKTSIKQLITIVNEIAYLLLPLLPDASQGLFGLLGLQPRNYWPASDELLKTLEQDGQKIELKDIRPLFAKVEVQK